MLLSVTFSWWKQIKVVAEYEYWELLSSSEPNRMFVLISIVNALFKCCLPAFIASIFSLLRISNSTSCMFELHVPLQEDSLNSAGYLSGLLNTAMMTH